MKFVTCLVLTAVLGLACSWALADGPGRVISTGPAVVVEPGAPPPQPGAPMPQPAVAPMPQPGGPDTFRFFAHPGQPPGPPQKVTYLGVATSPANELLADQLKLGKGTGVVVDFVEENSPAAKAGVKPHDVLVKLNDQLLVNPPQLAVLVRLQKPGDKVTLTLIREAKEQKVTVELAETERVIGGEEPWDMIIRPTLPYAWPKSPGGVIQGEPHRGVPELDKNMADLLGRMGQVAPPGAASVSVSASMADGEHTLTLTITDGKKHLGAKDKDGKVLFEGPIQTPEEREKVPPEIRKKLEKMEATTKFEIRTGIEGPARIPERFRRQTDEMRKPSERMAPTRPAPAPHDRPMAL